MTHEEKIGEIRKKFHDLSNALGIIVMRGAVYNKSVPREFEDPAKLKEFYLKSLDEHGRSEKDALRASEIATQIRKTVYQMLEVDTSKSLE